MVNLHLDTDIGGDMDDVCALAMLLKWDNLEITGITTNAEENGRRAGCTKFLITMAFPRPLSQNLIPMRLTTSGVMLSVVK